MPSVTLENITNFALKGLNLSINHGEITVVLGPNGAGKSTLLHVIAGLVPYKGKVLFDGKPVDGVPAEKRNVGFIFQDILLFPHMSVKDNISFGLKMRGLSKEKIKEKVLDMAKMLRIEHLLDRFPNTLSGGERQRVAFARALAPEPDIVLLDEPFSNLDVKTTKHLRIEFKNIIKKLGMTAVFVTHNIMEAEELGDKVAVIDKGKIKAFGTPDEVLFSDNEGLASIIGSLNAFHCDSFNYIGNGLAEVTSGGLRFIVPYDGKKPKKVVIYAHEVFISRDMPPGPLVNRFRGKVVEKSEGDTFCRYVVDVRGSKVVAELPRGLSGMEPIEVGDGVVVVLKIRNLRLVE